MATLTVNGVEYYPATQLLAEIGVSRQTFWRWRQRGQIPAGHRFRDGRLLFTGPEAELIRSFATSVQAAEKPVSYQGRLFGNGDLQKPKA
jgi:hypothetical protein